MTFKKLLLMMAIIMIPQIGLDSFKPHFMGTFYAVGFIVGMFFETWLTWSEKKKVKWLLIKLEMIDEYKQEIDNDIKKM